MDGEENDPEVYTLISEYLKGFRNDTTEFKNLQLRSTMVHAVRPLLFLYSLLIASGFISNLGVLHCISKQQSPRSHLVCYIINLAVINIFKCLIVLPVSLINSIFQNFIFDDKLCYILPMIQEIPLHASGWTYYMMSKHYLKQLSYPEKCYYSSKIMIILTWLLALLLVLPYRFYIRYVDFGKVLSDHKILKYQFEGVGMCTVRTWLGVREYIKVVLIILCMLPLILSSWQFKRISEKLKQLKHPQIVICTNSTICTSSIGFRNKSMKKKSNFNLDLNHDNGPHKVFLDIRKEKVSLKYLCLMLIVDAAFLFPLKFVRLFKFVQNNVFAINWNYDLVFTVLVWITFLPTCIMPLLYASWQLSL